MKLFFKNDIRSFRGHTTSAIRLDSSLMPALKKRAKSSSRLASHGFRNCFGQVWINSGGIDDVRCMFTGGSLGRREATGTRLWIGFFLMGISCTVKCLLDRPLTEKKKEELTTTGVQCTGTWAGTEEFAVVVLARAKVTRPGLWVDLLLIGISCIETILLVEYRRAIKWRATGLTTTGVQRRWDLRDDRIKPYTIVWNFKLGSLSMPTNRKFRLGFMLFFRGHIFLGCCENTTVQNMFVRLARKG